jgi:guanylate kinase
MARNRKRFYAPTVMNRIFGFVGPTGAGKSTLLMELVRNLPDRLGIIKSLATRERRGPEDDAFYRFISREDLESKRANGTLLQVSEYAGNFYANDKPDVDHLLETKHGLMAIVEDGVKNFRDAGYNVTVIRIIPKGNPQSTDESRAKADAERAALHLPADFELVNDFAPGGKEIALRELLTFIRTQVI